MTPPSEELKKKLLLLVYVLALLAIGYVILRVLYYVQTAALLLAASFLLAYLLKPLVVFFSNPVVLIVPRRDTDGKPTSAEIHLTRRGLPWGVSIVVVYALLFSFLGLLVSFMVPLLVHEARSFASTGWPELVGRTRDLIADSKAWIIERLPGDVQDLMPADFVDRITAALNETMLNTVHSIGPFMTRVVGAVAGVFLVPLLTFYMLLDIDQLKESCMMVFSANRREEMRLLFADIDETIGRYVRGQLLVAFIIGLSITAVLQLWHLQYAVIIGSFAGVMTLIPYAGTVLMMIPAALVASTGGALHVALVVGSMYLVHLCELKVLVPTIVGKSVGLPPLVMIVALVAGAELLGLIGMLLAVPVAAIIRVIARHLILKRNRTEARQMRLPRGEQTHLEADEDVAYERRL